MPVISPAELSESNFFMMRRRGVDGARPLSGGFFTNRKKKPRLLRRASDGDNKTNDNSDDGWVTASADDDDDDDEVDDNATLLRKPEKKKSSGGGSSDPAKPRTLRFTRDMSIMAPEPCPEMAGVPRAEDWQEAPTLLRHRQGGRLEPWEAVRRRRIALPDTPHTAHSVMFLNHQPGETSDFTDTLQRGANGGGQEGGAVTSSPEDGGEDRKVDRFPKQFGQWDGVEGYSSGTLPSARNIVDGCRRREEESEMKEKEEEEGEKSENEGKKCKERLYKARGKVTRPTKSAIRKSNDRQTAYKDSPTSIASGSEAVDFRSGMVDAEREGSSTDSPESMNYNTQSMLRRRSGNSQLPPLPPPEMTGSNPSLISPPPPPSPDGRSCGTLDPSFIIEEDVESLAETSSLYDDHVYDVPSEVKARASADERSVDISDAETAHSSMYGQEFGAPDSPDLPSHLERKDSLDEILPESPSDTSLFDTNSMNYNFYPSNRYYNTNAVKNSVSNNSGESNTENYIYNGSLLSVVSSDSDATSALYYHQQKPPSGRGKRVHYGEPAAILRERLKTGDGSIYGRPIIFMMGGKPIVFSESSLTEEEADSIKDSLPNDSASMTLGGHHDLHLEGFQPQPVTLPVEATLALPEPGHDPAAVGSLPPQEDCEECQHSHSCSYCPTIRRAGLVNLSPSTKLKLWDLRLICLNREENQYSTYPPRRPTLDDRGVGPVDAATDTSVYTLGVVSRPGSVAAPGTSSSGKTRGSRVLRHRSDVSTDDYVTRKINRLLRAPVLTRAELPPTTNEPQEMPPPGDSLQSPEPDLSDFPTDGLRSLYRSFLEGEDLVPCPLPDKDAVSTSSTKNEVFGFVNVTPTIPTCINPNRSVIGDGANSEAMLWPALFGNTGDDAPLEGWRNFFAEKMSQAAQTWPGPGTDEEAITSGCPKPLPVDWPFPAETKAAKAGAESGDETDDSVYIYKPLGFSGMYDWGRGRDVLGGDESSSSNISGDDVRGLRNHHYCKRRRYHHGRHHYNQHRSHKHLCPGRDKSHVDSLEVRRKGLKAEQNGSNKENNNHLIDNTSSNINNPNVAVITSDVDEDSPFYDSSSNYNASIRSGGSSSVYYGGASNISSSTSHSNFLNNNININNNNVITDGGSGSSSSDSNHRAPPDPRAMNTHLGPGSAAGSAKVKKPARARQGSQVIWGDASIVDWRRQADKFRDNNFITLIL